MPSPSTLFGTPWFSIAALITYIVCASISLSAISTALQIFKGMGVLADAASAEVVWSFSSTLFLVVGLFDLLMLAYTWTGKAILRDRDCGHSCNSGMCCRVAVSTVLLTLFWCALIIFTVVVLVLPVLAALLYAARVLCAQGQLAVLVQFSSNLPMLSLAENITISATEPLATPSVGTNSTLPEYCDVAGRSGAAAGMLFSCAPFLVIAQMIIVTSASTVIYVVAFSQRGNTGRAKMHDVQMRDVHMSGIN